MNSRGPPNRSILQTANCDTLLPNESDGPRCMSRRSPHDQRKRRTQAHVIEERSVNFLERQVLSRNHQLHRPAQREYGWDATMFHFSDDGFIENGEVRFQLKATDHLRVIEGGACIAVEIELRDLRTWIWDVYPFVLVVYDAPRDRAFWLHIQEYVERSPIDDSREKVTLRIPSSQKVNVRAIDRFRRLSLENIEAFWRERNPGHEERGL